MAVDELAAATVVEESSNTKILRGLAVVLLILAVVLSTTNIVMFMIHVELPNILINSVSVSNFKATKTNFTANWDANFTVVNPDNMFGISFSELDLLLTYGNSAIASAVVSDPHIKLGPNKNGTMSVTINKNKHECFEGVAEPFEEIVEARKNGTLTFKMYMMTTSIVLSGSWWERKITMYYTCDGLKPKFVSQNSGDVKFKFGRLCYLGKM